MLAIEYANCLTERVGPHGLARESLASESESAAAARAMTAELAQSRGRGWERWRDLPFDPMRSEHLDGVRRLAEAKRERFENLVVLGIGGSALGNIALHSALHPPTYNLLPASERGGPRVFVIDNVDPANLGAVMDFIASADSGGLEKTLFNVISKSGETAETASQFMLARKVLIEALGDTGHREHVVAITDPAQGTMRAICDANGYETLPVPEGVGGRFSVLSPVGLFSAAMSGIDTAALLDGAAAMDKRCCDENLAKNPAALLATLLVRLASERGKTIHVLMPYCNGLYLLADWFRQLWAESLGKRCNNEGDEVFAGYTPVKALGATDQHSQIQLYREGPNDKVVGLMQVDDFGAHNNDAIPGGLGVDALSYLEGKRFSDLLNAEKRATEYALVESERPNYTIRFPRVDAQHVGEFIQLWQIATAYAGRMLGIDAFDQPAVETGKKATFGLMGRAGYEEWKARVDSALAPTDDVV